MFYDVKKSSAIAAVKYEDSLGLAFQVGMDVAINDR
jgi:outer membrane protein W